MAKYFVQSQGYSHQSANLSEAHAPGASDKLPR